MTKIKIILCFYALLAILQKNGSILTDPLNVHANIEYFMGNSIIVEDHYQEDVALINVGVPIKIELKEYLSVTTYSYLLKVTPSVWRPPKLDIDNSLWSEVKILTFT